MTKNHFFFLGLITLIGFSLLGAGIITYLIDVPFHSIFSHGLKWYYQIGIGVIYGFITAFIGWKLITMSFLKDTKQFYSSILKDFQLTISDIVFISLCAGIGEEILFRGAAQYYFGIYLTSIIFVAIHGYLNPKDWKISVYGLYMTIVIIGIGYMFDYFGLLSAIAAHFSIDFFLLIQLTKTKEIPTN